jgi:hypothetical protein
MRWKCTGAGTRRGCRGWRCGAGCRRRRRASRRRGPSGRGCRGPRRCRRRRGRSRSGRRRSHSMSCAHGRGWRRRRSRGRSDGGSRGGRGCQRWDWCRGRYRDPLQMYFFYWSGAVRADLHTHIDRRPVMTHLCRLKGNRYGLALPWLKAQITAARSHSKRSSWRTYRYADWAVARVSD